jgi:hypothetical protein
MRRIKKIKREIDDINDRLKRLECEHRNIEYLITRGTLTFFEKCKDCGKILEQDISYVDKLEREIFQLQAQIDQKQEDISWTKSTVSKSKGEKK